jgi:hypothetical protein
VKKGEPKLRLIVGGGGADDEPPFTDEELRDAEALRDALDLGDEPLAEALRAAASPGHLDEGDLDAILARAMGDEDAPPTRAEALAADRLRAALDGAARELSGDHAIVAELRAASRPGAIDPAVNDRLIEAALDRAAPRAAVIPLARRMRPRRIAPITMAALAGVAALAASIALFLGRPDVAPPSAARLAPELIRARSAQDLFDAATPFPRSGEESARIDRIASSRAADLRKNRFAKWGVK